MKTFVLMTKLAPQNASLIEVGAKQQDRARSGRNWINKIEKECPGVKFKNHYALMGHWDFMDIYECPDEKTAAKVSLLTRAMGASEVESWCAIPYEEIMEMVEEIDAIEKTF